ncbi:hypothetical protein LTR47_011659 [Exophiala xenobiotica]|nr:hypothetical protein LTR47_011659 [Exophiala xenobiotica]KAK5243234.1 hypothetical protein LTS06_010957 [Exophiala xenobiotica]KAK5281519.1 hypothetical protein LTR40_004729 [Exophiala xenobiotica]KAK5356224.1 hypothetical protein LTR11_011615 [Exophiala xenobiotica]KAK5357364.1 hypothetical protein LTS03_011615 [Exophiala xenobiotica]
MGKYKNAKFYVNRHTPVRPSPPAEASEDDKLQYDKENLWVGLISDFRAETHEKVYVRVFWLYWPEELPVGRQPYHGKRELILSNHVDIIQAQTIASHAEISYWDENDDSNKTVLQERYWRQTLDLRKLTGDPSRALSKLRQFCICGRYDNPNLDMYQCHKVGCGTWNHEACLAKAIKEQAWEKFKRGTLIHEVQKREESKGLAQNGGEAVSYLADWVFGKDEVKAGPQSSTTAIITNGKRKLKVGAHDKRPWIGKLQGQVTKVEPGGADDTHYTTVTQYVPKSSSKSAPSDFEPKIWHIMMGCLKCGASLN